MSLPRRSTGPPPAPLLNFNCGGRKSKELSLDLSLANQIRSRLVTIFLSGPVPMRNLLSRRRRTRIHRLTSRPRWISLISYRVVLRTALSSERCGATFTMFTRWRERTTLHFFQDHGPLPTGRIPGGLAVPRHRQTHSCSNKEAKKKLFRA